MVELSNNVLQKGWVLFQSQGICLQQFGLGGGGFFFYTFRQRGSVWNGAFGPSHPRNYSVFQGAEPVTTSQPLPSHLCHVSSDREAGELWVQEGQSDRVSHAETRPQGQQ